jgi:hypothetical protein
LVRDLVERRRDEGVDDFYFNTLRRAAPRHAVRCAWALGAPESGVAIAPGERIVATTPFDFGRRLNALVQNGDRGDLRSRTRE